MHIAEIFEYAIDTNSGAYQVYLEADDISNEINVYINDDFMYYPFIIQLINKVRNHPGFVEEFKERIIDTIQLHCSLTEDNRFFEISITIGNQLVAVVNKNGMVVEDPSCYDYVFRIIDGFDYCLYPVTPELQLMIEKIKRGDYDMI